LTIGEDWIARVRAALPELPLARRERVTRAFGLGEHDAALLTAEREIADYFEAAARDADAKKIGNWVTNERAAEPGSRDRGPPAAVGELVRLIDDGTSSGKIAKEVLAKMIATGARAKAIVEREGLVQLTDTAAIEAACRAAIEASPKQAEQFRSG